MTTKRHLTSGFTIIELGVVIVIIGVLATLTLVVYNGAQDNARKAVLMSDLDNSVSVLELDLKRNGSYPATVALADNGNGLPASSGTTYQYALNNTNTPKTFCLTATKGTQSYNINQDNILSIGVCPVFSVDTANPTSYPGTGTVVVDLSGNGNNGTLMNGVGYSSSNSGVLTFDGVNDRVETPIQTYGNNTTWSAWFNGAQSVNTYNMFMGRHLPYFGMYGGNSLVFSNSINGVQSTITSAANLSLNTWYYATFTTVYNGTNTTDNIYVNGSLVKSGTWAGAQTNYSYAFTIGDGHTPTWYPFKGMVSDVKVYDHTLSVNEIQQYFNFTRSRYGL